MSLADTKEVRMIGGPLDDRVLVLSAGTRSLSVRDPFTGDVVAVYEIAERDGAWLGTLFEPKQQEQV